jgi:hypothetical protein
MPYIPDPLDAAAPLNSEVASSAAAEFRVLKASITGRLAGKAATGANADITALSALTAFKPPIFTVATLPAAPVLGSLAFATNGRKIGELAAAGTGVLVCYSNAAWRLISNDTIVAA